MLHRERYIVHFVGYFLAGGQQASCSLVSVEYCLCGISPWSPPASYTHDYAAHHKINLDQEESLSIDSGADLLLDYIYLTNSFLYEFLL